MKRVIHTAMLCAFALAAATGCAALKSTRHTESKITAGVGYYLPNGDIRVNLEFDQNRTPTFTVDTLHYPDIRYRYSVSVPKNVAGDTEMTVKVNDSGLLQSIDYKYEPKIIEAVKAIPPQTRTANVSIADANQASATCLQRKYAVSFKVNPEGNYTQLASICGFSIEVKPASTSRQPSKSYDSRLFKPKDGLYFRLNLPYEVKIYAESESKFPIYSDIAFSPTGGSTLFVSTNRSVFSTMSGKVTFNQGVLTEFAPKNTSEIETGFKLPAAILKSYFDSVNALFVLRKGSADKETEYLTAIRNLDIARASLEACQSAYESKDPKQIDSACKKTTP